MVTEIVRMSARARARQGYSQHFPPKIPREIPVGIVHCRGGDFNKFITSKHDDRVHYAGIHSLSRPAQHISDPIRRQLTRRRSFPALAVFVIVLPENRMSRHRVAGVVIPYNSTQS